MLVPQPGIEPHSLQWKAEVLPSGAPGKSLARFIGQKYFLVCSSFWRRKWLTTPAGEGHGNPLQCSCLENPVDRGAWQAMVHAVANEPDTT